MRPSLLPIALLLGTACRGIEYTLPDAVNSGPVVTIVRPLDQAVVLDTDALEFEGVVLDDNGLADIAEVHWYSSLDGELGREGEAVPDLAGRTRIATTLSAGVHTITLEASDVAGLEDTKSIAVIVDPTRVDPVAEITAPLPFAEFWIGDEIPLSGMVWDPNQPAASLQVSWSAVNAAGGAGISLFGGLPATDGATEVVFPAAPVGDWLVTLTVTDTDLHQADDALYIVVRDPADVDADGDGWSPNQGDCNDNDDHIHPGALELCDNAIDDDCSGFVDDKDFDLDGHVDVACNLNDGPKRVDDCVDEDATIYAGAPEATDGVDNDCDGEIDDGTPSFDADGDCWCITGPCTDSSDPTCVLILPGDCNDTDPLLNQDDVDNDTWSTCDGDCDDLVATKNLDDVDNDGYDTCDGDCDDALAVLNLDDDDLDGFSTCTGDCNDSVRFLNPTDGDLDGASTCAGDCNDAVAALNVRDDDSDGFSTCEGDCDDDDPFLEVDDNDHDGFSSCAGDCNDDDPAQNPGDVDHDGWSTCDGDCNDAVPWLNLDDVDNDSWSTCAGDCDDSLASLNLADVDGDGWHTCEGDCNDADTWWNPGDGDLDGASTCAGDCNDAASALNLLDVDGDTWNTCEGDCNDLVPSLNRNDVDHDGWDTCEGDCNDASAGLNLNDVDGDGWDTCEGDCNDGSTAYNPGVVDVPDGAFLDQNCDGIDGDPDDAVFVTTTGSSTSTCLRTSPCSLPRGLVVAGATSRKQIYVQAGTYTQVVDLPNAVAIYGGYNSSWVRASRSTTGHVVRIRGGWVAADEEYMTIRARSVTGRIADLILEGPDASGVRVGTLDGRSSYVVHAWSSTLVLERIEFDQGNGAGGGWSSAHGGNASQSRAAGGGGGGSAGEEYWACNSADRGWGGGGGYNGSCPNSSGGWGGNGGTMDTDCSSSFPWNWNLDARPGTSGGYATYVPGWPYGYPGGGGGTCGGGGGGWYGRTSDGSGGGSGNNDGRLLASAFWYAFPGGNGALGLDGTGGGGGGGSGGCDSGTDSWGAGGGGGGAGGCRAWSGGGGGGGGGGSFGVFGYLSAIEVYQSSFLLGRGGDGGKGGRMGAGQPGGWGGPGGNQSPGGDSPYGGWGGDGGRGGHSGAGGGGAGGASFGIYRYGGSVISSGNGFFGGGGGTGGSGGDLGSATGPQGQAYGGTGEGGLWGTAGVCSLYWDC